MKPFRYVTDPLCVTCCSLYATNRWLVSPHVHSRFLRGQFNDLMLIPCALPLVLWAQRRLGLRQTDTRPTGSEILFHLVIWSILCEVIGPHIMRTTGDYLDVLAYAVGAGLAFLWWRRNYAKAATHEL